MPAKRKSDSARYSYDGLDRVLHEKARLGLMTCLAGSPDGLTFGELKSLCNLTDGNLNRHLKQLAEAGLVSTRRDETGSRPQTICALTDSGRGRFLQYLAELQRVIGDAQKQMKTNAARSKGRLATE
ncbi:transcriptional regulator [Stieleria varia]|uniref:Helix-turn-helix domain protein n=1 Tax=Stieleria varia TaxID=2528005 RepID=A0A5C6AEW8_9BACT|nr:transcriptional regulator [Stieleria varia]TWT98514.1 Helix-turn-helix domain protein [Stieleria varia]